MRKKRNLFVSLIVSIVMVFSLVGCSSGKYTSIMSVEKNSEGKMEMSYQKFDGYKTKDITLKKGEEVTLNVEVTTKEGKLKITLIDEDNNNLFEAENPKEEVSKTIKIEKDGKYTIKIEGNHKGSFKINWDVKKK